MEKNIPVHIRFRPPINEEDAKDWIITGSKKIQLKSTRNVFEFNHVYDPNAKQNYVFNLSTMQAINDTLLGSNSTIITYGQSGSGKTYTLMGSPEYLDDECNMGLIPRTLAYIFSGIGLIFDVKVSYFQILDDNIYDLLSSDDQKPLRIFQNSYVKNQVNVQGLIEKNINKENCMEIFQEAMEKVQKNSHQVFCIYIYMNSNGSDDAKVKLSKLTFVELADSANCRCSQHQLYPLHKVVKALLDNNSYIPYKESKITRILEESLCGATKTTFLFTCSTHTKDTQETLNSLNFAANVSKLKQMPVKSASPEAILGFYESKIRKLSDDLLAAKERKGFFLKQEEYDATVNRKQELLNTVEEIAEHQGVLDEFEVKLAELNHLSLLKQQEGEKAVQKLKKAKKQLKELMQEHHIQQEFINKFVDAHSLWSSNSKALSEALDSNIRDHDFLRDKVDILYAAMERNKKVLQKKCEESMVHHDKTFEEQQESESILEKFVENLRVNQDRFLNVQKNRMESVQNLAHNFSKNVENYCVVLEEMLNNRQVERTNVITDQTKFADDLFELLNSFQSELNCFLKTKNSKSVNQSLKNKKHLLNMREELLLIKEKLENFFHLQNENLKGLNACLANDFAEKRKEFTDFGQRTQEALVFLKKETNDKIQKTNIDQITGVFGQHNEMVIENKVYLNQQIAHITKFKDDLQKCYNELANEIRQFFLEHNEIVDDCQQKVAVVEKNQVDATKSYSRIFESFQANWDIFFEIVEKDMTNIRNEIETFEEQSASLRETAVNKLNNLSLSEINLNIGRLADEGEEVFSNLDRINSEFLAKLRRK